MESTKTDSRLRAIERLGALREEPDAVLGEIARDAREAFGVTVSIIHLMLEDTMHFGAWSGPVPEEFTKSREIPREQSFCPPVVESESGKVIEDISGDEHYRNYDVHRLMGMNFYAGTPLKTSEGETIGTLCILDDTPRKFTRSDMLALDALSKAVIYRLELLKSLENEREALRRQAAKSRELQEVLDRSLDVIVTVGFDGKIRSINRASLSVFGWEPGEVLGKNYLDFVYPEDRPSAIREAKRLYAGESVFSFTSRFVGRHGEVRWVEWNASPDAGQRAYYCVARNITDRKLAEEKARETEILYRAIVERNPAVTYMQTLDSVGDSAELTFISSRIEDLLGYTPEEWLSEPMFWASRIHPEDLPGVLAEDELTDGNKADFKVKYRSIAKDGRVVWIYDEASLVHDETGNPLYWLGAQYDITNLKQAEEEVRRAEEKYRSIFENIVEGVYQLDIEGRYTTANPAMAAILGYDSADQLLREAPAHHEHLMLTPEMERSIYQDLIRTGHASGYEVRARRNDGGEIWVSGNVQLMYSAGGEFTGYEGSIEDITERKLLEDGRRESEERFRQLFEHSVEALFIHDESGRIYDCNAEACRSLGYTRDELLDIRMDQLIVPSEERLQRSEESVWEGIVSGKPGMKMSTLFRNEHRRKDGSTFPVEVRIGSIEYGGRPLIFASVRDVTERRAYENRLTHAASHDPLTDLPNRILFMDNLESVLSQAKDTGSYTALLYLDLDGFKEVNDTHGHQTGDALLVEVARRLESHLRREDLAARLGGDEFTVLVSNLRSPREMDEIVLRIREVFCSPFEIQGCSIEHLGCSIGVVCAAAGTMDAEDILRRADQMMYLDKRSESVLNRYG